MEARDVQSKIYAEIDGDGWAAQARRDEAWLERSWVLENRTHDPDGVDPDPELVHIAESLNLFFQCRVYTHWVAQVEDCQSSHTAGLHYGHGHCGLQHPYSMLTDLLTVTMVM